MASSGMAIIADGLTKRYGETTVLDGMNLRVPTGSVLGLRTGLDLRGRAEVWAAMRALVAAGTTVLLTTQYLEEADQLANHIAVIAAGRVVADGSPSDLKAQLGGDRIEVVLRRAADVSAASELIKAIYRRGTFGRRRHLPRCRSGSRPDFRAHPGGSLPVRRRHRGGGPHAAPTNSR